MSRCVAFVGPSLSRARDQPFARIALLPPAEAGDLIRAVKQGARVVALIDGLFGSCRSPWHKEILWAMAEGVVVVGASSMGALRAAELGCFGMVGVGRVYSAYAHGRIHGDDEVALMHGPADMGYAPLTIPLVNLRATLAWLRRCRALDAVSIERLWVAGSSLFFKERVGDAVVECAFPGPRQAGKRRRHLALLRSSYVDIKRIDALRCLRALERIRPAARPRVGHSQINTRHLMSLLAEAERETLADGGELDRSEAFAG